MSTSPRLVLSMKPFRVSPQARYGLKQLAMQSAIFPCRVGKALVARLLNAIGLARADPPDLAEKRQPLAAGDGRLVDHRLEEDGGAVHQVLAAQADQRVQRQRVSRGLLRKRVRIGLGARLFRLSPRVMRRRRIGRAALSCRTCRRSSWPMLQRTEFAAERRISRSRPFRCKRGCGP